MLTKRYARSDGDVLVARQRRRLRSYTITVLEQIHHEITVEASEERAARTVALLEARRTSGSLIRRGNRRHERYWRMRMKPTTSQ